jgi:hypothetical protein
MEGEYRVELGALYRMAGSLKKFRPAEPGEIGVGARAAMTASGTTCGQ